MTVKFGQRYLAIVLHFAGDSTMTRCFPSFGLGIVLRGVDETTVFDGLDILVGFLIVFEEVLVGMISAH